MCSFFHTQVWPIADIKSELLKTDETKAVLRLTSANLVKDVKFEIEGGTRFGDNFVDLIPDVQRNITVEFNMCPGEFKPQIKLTSVNSVLRA